MHLYCKYFVKNKWSCMTPLKKKKKKNNNNNNKDL